MHTITVENKRFVEAQPVGYISILHPDTNGYWLMSMVAQPTMIGDGFLVVPDDRIALTHKGDKAIDCYSKVRVNVFDNVSLTVTVFDPNVNPSPIYIWQEEDDIDLLHLDMPNPDDEVDNMLPIDQATDKMPPEPDEDELFDGLFDDYEFPF